MITVTNNTYKKFNFPCGEMHIKLESFCPGGTGEILFEFERNDEIIELQLLIDALNRQNIGVRVLVMPYVPFSRQDRINVPGECFSLKVFTGIINSLGFEKVIITDPHSDVTSALINNCEVIPQHEVFWPYFTNNKDPFWLISPDAGALKKIYKVAKMAVNHCLGVVECSKTRDVTNGDILGVDVNIKSLKNQTCCIVDDICDGGRTFIEIAKELKAKDAGKIVLLVSHGFFTKGMEVFDGLINEIHTRKGIVKW
jgi:ribose-phosphate pyrophosphokinase